MEMDTKTALIGAATAMAHVCEEDALPEEAVIYATQALALSAPDTAVSEQEAETLLERMHSIKYTYRESCRGCPHPCGRSKDFQIEALDKLKSQNLRTKKLELLSYLQRLPQDVPAQAVTQALRAFGYGTTIREVNGWIQFFRDNFHMEDA